jgi:hypothetical protein
VRSEREGKEEYQVYAIKYMRHSVMQQKESLKVGAFDLAMEAKIMSHLTHPNIIKIHRISTGSILESYDNNHCFFLILDLLDCSKMLNKSRR